MVLDIVALEEILTKWVNTVIQSRPDLTDCLKVVAMDSKTMRASYKQGAVSNHLLSVVSHELGITLTQRSVSDKINEIPIVLSTLKLRVVSVVGNQSSLLQRELFCRSDLRIATFTRKILVDTPLSQHKSLKRLMSAIKS